MQPCGRACAIRRARLWAEKGFCNINYRRNVSLPCVLSRLDGMDRAHEVPGHYEEM
jgi:hypothetical protein